MSTPLGKIKTADELLREYGERLIRGPQPNQEKEWENMVLELGNQFSLLKDCRVEFLQKIDPYLDQGTRFHFMQALLKSETRKIQDEATKNDFLRPNNLARAAFKFYNQVPKDHELQNRVQRIISYDPHCADNILHEIPDEVLQQFAKAGIPYGNDLLKLLTFNYLNTAIFTESVARLKNPDLAFQLVAQEVIKQTDLVDNKQNEKVNKKLKDTFDNLIRKVDENKNLNEDQKQQEKNKINEAHEKAIELIKGMQNAKIDEQFKDNKFKDRYNNLKTAAAPSSDNSEKIDKRCEQFNAKYVKVSLWDTFKNSVSSAWKSFFTDDSKQTSKTTQSTTPTTSTNTNVNPQNESETSKIKPNLWQRFKDTVSNIVTSVSRIGAKPNLEITKTVESKEVEQERKNIADIKNKITHAFKGLDQLKNNKENNSQEFNDTKRELYIDSIKLNRNDLLQVIAKLEKENKDEFKPLLTEARQFLDHYNLYARLLKIDEVKLVSDVKKSVFVGNKTGYNSVSMNEQMVDTIFDALKRDYENLSNMMNENQYTRNNAEQFKQNMKHLLLNLATLKSHANSLDSTNPSIGTYKENCNRTFNDLAKQCNDLVGQFSLKEKNTSKFERFKNEAKETSSGVVNKVDQLSQSLGSIKKRIDETEKLKRSQSETPISNSTNSANPIMQAPDPQSTRKLSS